MTFKLKRLLKTRIILIETSSIKSKKLTFLANYFQNHILYFQKSFQKSYNYAMTYISFQSKLTIVGHQLTIVGIFNSIIPKGLTNYIYKLQKYLKTSYVFNVYGEQTTKNVLLPML